jgi:hypothetical protein
MTNEVVIIKSNQKFFCEFCTIEKQHKVHNKESINHRSETLEERLHLDIFEKNNTFSSVDKYCYDVVVINNATRIKFLITLKIKNEI